MPKKVVKKVDLGGRRKGSKNKTKKQKAYELANKNPVGKPKVYTEEKVIQIGEDMLSWMSEKASNIFFEKYLMDNKIWPQRISEWEKSYSKFAEVIKKARLYQEVKINEGAMFGKLNSTYCIFFQKAKNKYDEKNISDNMQEITINYESI